MSTNIVPHVYVKDFLLGGKCKTTIHNTETDNQIRLAIYAQYINDSVPKRYDNIIAWRVFEIPTVKQVIDRNWTKKERLKFLGLIDKDMVFKPDAYAEIFETARRFSWLWKQVVDYTIPPSLNILHLGSCAVCGRPLEDAISLERGIGPICYDHIIKSKHYNK